MFDEPAGKVGVSLPTSVDGSAANGSAAEPGVDSIAEKLPEPDGNSSAVDPTFGPVAGLSQPFDVAVADLEWKSRSGDLEDLKSLAASLRVMQINDIIVSPKSTSGKYVAIAGNRRCAAAHLEGIPHLRARIYQGSASEIVSIVENAQRREESPKSLLLRLRKALGGGVDRKEVRELLGATGKAKSTISDLLYGALLEESRFQKVIDSDNVFKAIAELRKRKPATGPAPLFDPHADTSDAEDAIQDQNGSVAEPKVDLIAEATPASDTAVSQGLDEATRTDDRVVPASAPDESCTSTMEPVPCDSVAEPNATPIEESILAAGGALYSQQPDEPTGTEGRVAESSVRERLDLENSLYSLQPDEPTGTEGPVAESSVRERPDNENSMIVEKCLQVRLAECALTEEEQVAAGDWSVALVRPAESRDVPVDINLFRKAIAELGRRC